MENRKLFSVGFLNLYRSFTYILDIRSNELFECEHLIGSLRLNLIIENGLIDPIKMNQKLQNFKTTIMTDLNKEDEDEVRFSL